MRHQIDLNDPELLLVPRGKGAHRTACLSRVPGLVVPRPWERSLGAEGPQWTVDGGGAHRGEVITVARRQVDRAFRFQGWEQLDQEWSEALPAEAAAGFPGHPQGADENRRVPLRAAVVACGGSWRTVPHEADGALARVPGRGHEFIQHAAFLVRSLPDSGCASRLPGRGCCVVSPSCLRILRCSELCGNVSSPGARSYAAIRIVAEPAAGQ